MLNYFLSQKKIKIGKLFLKLDLRNPHEKEYYKTIYNSDYIISNTLIKNGDKVLDVGANIGFTALLYLKFGASIVFAFEPVSSLVERLKNIKTDSIKVFDTALSDFDGNSDIYISSSHNQGHSLNEEWPKRFSRVFNKVKKETVKVSKLDTILPNETFDFIKIDVEGAEEKMILGGKDFFLRNKMAIVQIEIYDWQFEKTNDLLSKYYCNTFIPIIENNQVIAFKNINSFENKKDIEFNGPPNYIYTNSSSLK